jgi:hypothetical protein
MKKILGLVGVLTVLALGTNVFAAAFTAGNIVIYREGNGTQPLTNGGNTVFLDEFTQAGTWVQSIMMPTNWYGANAPLIADGSAFAQGLITRSQDGRFIVLTGFGATLGQFTNFSITGSFASNEAPRVVGLVDGFGNINTTTAQTNHFAEEEIRSAASTDGTNLWFSGNGTGIKATTRSSLVATQVEKSVTNVRQINIYSNQLYFTASSGIRSTTNFALPTTTNALVAILPGTATNGTAPFGFALFNLTGGSTPDTLYVAEGTLTFSGEGNGAVLKYSLNSGTNWVNTGSIGAGNATGLAGFNDNAGVHLFITTGGTATPNASGTLYPFVDTTGFNGNVGTNAGGNDANLNGITLSPNGLAATTFNVRGVAMVPQGGESPTNGAGKISVGPDYNSFAAGGAGGPFSPTNFVYYLANFGTNSINWQVGPPSLPSWLTANPSSGTLSPLGSITVNVSINANANTLSAGLQVGSVVFHGPIATAISRTISLTVNAFSVSPTTNFAATGPAGGPFSPASQVYVMSNETSGALNWGVTNLVNWDTLSATNGTLAANTATNITLSFNANANALPVGLNFDTLTFLDVTHTNPVTSVNVILQVGFGIFDDYSTYTQNANLAGQNGWNGGPNAGQTPYQVANNALNLVGPGGGNVCTAGEEPVKDWGTTTITTNIAPGGFVYAGMLVTVTSAPPHVASPPFSFEVEDGVKQANPVSFEFDAGSAMTSGGGYVWAARKSTAATWTIGTGPARTLGVQYMVIDVGDIVNSNCWIFVNPTDGNPSHLFAMTADAHDPPSSGGVGEDIGATEGAGGWIWGQFGAATCQPGLIVTKFAMSTNYTDVYNFLAGVAPPPADPFVTWQSNYFTLAELGNPSFSGPGADPFGKGMSNTNQFLAGFNPTNSAAYLHIISISKTNSGVDIRVDYLGASGDNTYSPGFTSRTNVLEFTAGTGGSYNSNNFASTGQTNILSGGTGLGTLANMVDPGGATNVPARYYRVRVLVP